MDIEHPGGHLDPSSLKCVYCGYNLTGVAIGGVCPECGTSIEESMQAFSRGQRASGTPLPNVSYVAPILTTVLCCLIGGIASIVYTAKANTAAGQGDRITYDSAVNARNGWMIASLIIGLLAVVLQIAAVSSSGW